MDTQIKALRQIDPKGPTYIYIYVCVCLCVRVKSFTSTPLSFSLRCPFMFVCMCKCIVHASLCTHMYMHGLVDLGIFRSASGPSLPASRADPCLQVPNCYYRRFCQPTIEYCSQPSAIINMALGKFLRK